MVDSFFFLAIELQENLFLTEIKSKYHHRYTV